MKFNKDTELIRLEGFARGYYSGATASGQCYIPKTFFDEHKEEIEELDVWTFELDGKHSEQEVSIDYTECTLGTINKYDDDEEIDLESYIEDLVEDSDVLSDALGEFFKKINNIKKIKTSESSSIILEEDLKIQDKIIKKGTRLDFEEDLEFDEEIFNFEIENL